MNYLLKYSDDVQERLAMEEELPMKRIVEEVKTMLKRYGLDRVMKVERGWPSFLG